MPTYITSTQSFSKIRRNIIRQFTIAFVLLIGFLIVFELLKIRVSGEGNITNLIAFILFFLGIAIFAVRQVISQQQEIWNSTVIKLDNNYISRQQVCLPEVKIDRREVTAVEENKQGLWIKTGKKKSSLTIPIELDRADYLEIKEILASWTEAGIVARTSIGKNIIFAMANAIAFLILFASFNIWLNFILGAAIIAYRLYVDRFVQSNDVFATTSQKVHKFTLIWTAVIVFFNTFGKLYLIWSAEKEQRKNESSRVILQNDNRGNYSEIG